MLYNTTIKLNHLKQFNMLVAILYYNYKKNIFIYHILELIGLE